MDNEFCSRRLKTLIGLEEVRGFVRDMILVCGRSMVFNGHGRDWRRPDTTPSTHFLSLFGQLPRLERLQLTRIRLNLDYVRTILSLSLTHLVLTLSELMAFSDSDIVSYDQTPLQLETLHIQYAWAWDRGAGQTFFNRLLQPSVSELHVGIAMGLVQDWPVLPRLRRLEIKDCWDDRMVVTTRELARLFETSPELQTLFLEPYVHGPLKPLPHLPQLRALSCDIGNVETLVAGQHIAELGLRIAPKRPRSNAAFHWSPMFNGLKQLGSFLKVLNSRSEIRHHPSWTSEMVCLAAETLLELEVLDIRMIDDKVCTFAL